MRQIYFSIILRKIEYAQIQRYQKQHRQQEESERKKIKGK